MEYAIAVFDIGMTNKKLAIYDANLNQIDTRYHCFPPLILEGLETHNLAAIEDWYLNELQSAANHYPIKAIAISCHGASFVAVDKTGEACVPCVFYTHEPGEDFHQRFYDRFGSPESLQARTGTPAFKALINLAKGIMFAQERFPEAYARTQRIFNYPQYWGFRLTGCIGAEGTYVGCHSYLWDWITSGWSSVAEELGIVEMLPSHLSKSWDRLGFINAQLAERTGLATDCLVTLGIHDSNASLLPHFAKKGPQGFVLNSTGTWCVIMNPVENYGFRPDELGKVVFFNQSAFRTPVKTAIFLGGQEFESWSGLLMEKHQRSDLPAYDRALYHEVLSGDAYILPELVAGSGQFPGSKPRVVEAAQNYAFDAIKSGSLCPPCFKNYERAIAILRVSLVMQTLSALERAGLTAGQELFIEGGFRRDEAYNSLLQAALKTNPVILSDIAEASALGAAMTAKMALSGQSLAELATDFSIAYQPVTIDQQLPLASYRERWLNLITH